MPEMLKKKLSGETLKYLAEIEKIGRSCSNGLAPAEKLRNVLAWKFRYAFFGEYGWYREKGGRETVRTNLKLFSPEWKGVSDGRLDDVELSLLDLENAVIALDGFYGAGLKRVCSKPGFNVKIFVGLLRSLPHGEVEHLDGLCRLNVHKYAYDDTLKTPLAVEVRRNFYKNSFGQFLFRGRSRNDMWLNRLEGLLKAEFRSYSI